MHTLYYTMDNPLSPPVSRSRLLFDEEYIDGGCLGAFPEGTNVDDTVGTWSTNYAIGALDLLGVLLIYRQLLAVAGMSEEAKSRRLALISHLLLHGVCFVLAAVGHQVITNTETQENGYWISAVAYCLVAWSLPGLFLGQSYGFLESPTKIKVTTSSGFASGILIFILVAVGMVDAGQTIAGVFVGVVRLILLLHILLTLKNRGYQNKSDSLNLSCYIFWAIAMVAGIAGLICQVLLSPICGSDTAYENCFEDCPLPYEINHNFVYHLLEALSNISVVGGALIIPKNNQEQLQQKLEIRQNESNKNSSVNAGAGRSNIAISEATRK